MRILCAIIAKAMIEIALLARDRQLCSVGKFPPSRQGAALDLVGVDQISGWAADPESGEDPVEVQLFIDGRGSTPHSGGEPAAGPRRCRCNLDIRARVQLRSPNCKPFARPAYPQCLCRAQGAEQPDGADPALDDERSFFLP
jgi:hypothetical protein